MINKLITPESTHSFILATTSSFKQKLFKRIGLPFTVLDPQTDETPYPNEDGATLAQRLARAKAEAGAHIAIQNSKVNVQTDACVRRTERLFIIGCDQVPVLESGQILHKPGTPELAKQELRRLSGKRVVFYTAVSVIRVKQPMLAGGTPEDSQHQPHLHSDIHHVGSHTDITTVTYRPISEQHIERYLDQEAGWRCAGAVQSEALGITLLAAIDTTDPSALVGLPLIGLTSLLQNQNIQIP
ncbi:MAG: Maf family protein [Gammaproteobacteria bacterium]